jgi:DNA-binding transcriptional regulator YhcF (GntR family)
MRTSWDFRKWLDEYLSRASAGEQLPVDRELSVSWGLSVSTIKRIVRAYCQNGRLMRVQGKGTFVPAAEKAAQSAPAIDRRKRAVDELTLFLTELICGGTVKVGEALPQNKYLTLRFNLSPKIVQAAYARMVHKGMVTKIGRRFWVGGAEKLLPQTGRRYCAFLYHDADQLQKLFESPYALSIYKMERELIARNYSIEYMKKSELISRNSFRAKKYSGYIIGGDREGWASAKYIEKTVRAIRVCHAKANQRPPALAFLHGRLSHRLPATYCINRGHLDKIASRSSADFLLSKGAATAAVFYSVADDGGEHFVNILRFVNEIRRRVPSFTVHLVIQVKGAKDRSSPQKYLFAGLGEHNLKIIASLAGAITYTDNLMHCFRTNIQMRWWLFPHENDAVKALRWCREHGVQCPAEVSIMSFESNARNLPYGITACVYDWDQIGYSMAHSLIGDIPIQKSSHGYIMPHSLILQRYTA